MTWQTQLINTFFGWFNKGYLLWVLIGTLILIAVYAVLLFFKVVTAVASSGY